jgi:hypothetical protein
MIRQVQVKPSENVIHGYECLYRDVTLPPQRHSSPLGDVGIPAFNRSSPTSANDGNQVCSEQMHFQTQRFRFHRTQFHAPNAA